MGGSKLDANDPGQINLFIEEDMATPQLLELPYGEAVVLTIARDRELKPNEDAALVTSVGDDSALLVVADGMGGTRDGCAAAAAVVERLAEDVPRVSSSDRQMRTAILDGIEVANQHILNSIPEGGTTLAAVGMRKHTLRPYHVGDSSILVTGRSGKLKLNTVAHSPVGFAVEAGLLDEDEAMRHVHRHVISNALGFPEMRIELGVPLELARHDTLVILSDGVTDNLFVNDIIERVRKGSLEDSVLALASLARTRMRTPQLETPTKPDDLTIIAYRRTG